MITRKQTGNRGEEQAVQFLRKQGYKILARNFSTAVGELDIVAQEKKTLVFVEVKTRASNAFGGPIAAVTSAKQQRMVRAAIQYIKATTPKFDSIRFDVIGILPDSLEHIPNAFIPPRMTL